MKRNYFMLLVPALLIFSSCVPTPGPSSALAGTVWAEGSTRKIMRDDPAPGQTHVWNGQQVVIKAAKNEHEPFQLVVTADQARLKDVTVQVSNLSDGLGNVIERSNITLALEHYITVTTPSDVYGQIGTFPDALPPLTTFNLSQGQNQPIWIKIFVPKGTAPGEYAGEITVTSSQGTAIVPLKLTVWDFALSHENHLDASYIPGQGDLGAQYGVEAWEGNPAWNAILEKECDILLANRLAPIAEAYEYPIYSEDENGLVQVDFRKSDAFYQTLYDSGKVRSFELALPKDAEGNECPMQEDTPFVFDQTFHDKMVCYFSLLYDHYQAKGWMDKDRFYGYVYIYDDLFWVSDEPFHWGKLGYDRVRLWSNWVHEANPNLIFTVAGEACIPWGDDWGDLRPYTDQWGVYPQYMAVVPDAIQGEIANHKIIRFELNSFADNIDYPATYHRLMSWFAYKYGAQGTDLWAVDYWVDENDNPINPWVDDPHNLWGNGAGAILYPGPQVGVDGPVSSIRLELNREMVEDYEYLYILEQLGRGDYTRQVVLDLIPKDDIYGLALTPEDFYQAREALADQILKLKEGVSDLVIARGVVVDENGEPMSNVLVSTGINATLSDEQGTYRLYIQRGTQPEVTFSKTDYQTVSASVGEGENEVVTLTEIPTEETLLFSFEDEAGEWEIYGPGPVSITRSFEHATAGASSLKVTWGDVEWTDIGIELPMADWQGQDYFEFDVYNPHISITTLWLGLHDAADKLYGETIDIGPEKAKRVRIPLSKIGQGLDISQIIELKLEADNILIWDWAELGLPQGEVVTRAGEKTLYFDNFRLVKELAQGS